MSDPFADAAREDDPYRPPDAPLLEAAPVDPDEAGWCWRDGDALVVLKNRPLPMRCVKCNRPVETLRRTRSFIRFPPWLIALVPSVLATPMALRAWAPASADALAIPLVLLQCLVGTTLYLRSAWRHSSRHAIGLCALHRYRRTLALFAVVGINAAGAIAAAALSDRWPSQAWVALATVLPVSAFVLLVRFELTTLRPLKIDAHFARFAGCGRSFLGSLADFPGETAAMPGLRLRR
ncbi:MAG: hypothetical protein ACOY82_07195 [Pseudomonadota bacterium]